MKSKFRKLSALAVCLAAIFPGVPVKAEKKATEEQTVFTYEEAYETAIANLSGISSIDSEVTKTEAQKAVLESQIKDINTYITKENRNTNDYRDIIRDLEDDLEWMEEDVEDVYYGSSDDPYAESLALIAQRDAMQQRVDDINALINGKDDSKFSKDAIGKNIDILNKQIELMALNQDVLRTSVELSLRNILINIRNYDLDIETMEAGIVLSEENLRRVTLMNELGKASDNDLTNAEYAMSQSEVNLETLIAARENERKDLNALLHLPVSQIISVEFSVETEELPEDTAAYIAEKLQSDLGIAQKELTAEIAKMDYDLKVAVAANKRDIYNRNNKTYQEQQDRIEDDKELLEHEPGYEETPDDNTSFAELNEIKWEADQAGYDRDSAKAAMETADSNLADARLDLETAVYTQLNALKQLSLSESSLANEIANASEQNRLTEIRLEAGKATQYDVDQSAYAVEKLTADLDKNKNLQWLQQFLFFNPVLNS